MTSADVTPELEAVAKAIYATDPLVANTGKGAVVIRWDELSESQKDRHHRKARAALLAIREPTEGMVAAATRAGRRTLESAKPHIASGAVTDQTAVSPSIFHRSMIDHVLGEKK